LLLDSGNFSDNPTPVGERKTAALLEAMVDLGYAAVNVGERDVRQGWDEFVRRTEEVDLPFLSANLVRKDNQAPLMPAYQVVEARSADGKKTVKVGVVGVLRYNPVFLKPGPDGSQMAVSHPTERVQQAVDALEKEKPELIVLLGALHRDDARRIVREVAGIDVVVGSYGGLFTTEREQEGETWILYSGNQGKRIGSTRIDLAEGGGVAEQVTKIHVMTDIYPADSEMLEFVYSVPVDPPAAASSAAVAPSAGPFVGSTMCRTCHLSEFEQWSATPHAGALKTLQAQGKTREAECVQCHATGVGSTGGFRGPGATPGLANVGCESCHGPGAYHSRAPAKGYGTVTVASCTGCHDVKNSPKFDYYTYLPRISHRAGATNAAGPAR